MPGLDGVNVRRLRALTRFYCYSVITPLIRLLLGKSNLNRNFASGTLLLGRQLYCGVKWTELWNTKTKKFKVYYFLLSFFLYHSKFDLLALLNYHFLNQEIWFAIFNLQSFLFLEQTVTNRICIFLNS